MPEKNHEIYDALFQRYSLCKGDCFELNLIFELGALSLNWEIIKNQKSSLMN